MKKIQFSDRYGLTEAVLSGRKTQTRRIIKLSDVEDYTADIAYAGKTWEAIEKSIIARHAKYKVGEVVAVAQCYCDFYDDANDPRIFPSGAGWTNKMFVRADLMPHQIRITNVRVERLKEISDDDCLREGIIKGMVGSEDTHFMDAYYVPNMPLEPHVFPQGAYAALIDRISGKGTWESNPWVFVYDFELAK